MKTACELKRYAATCRTLARDAVREEDRRLLQEMAKTWMLLAEGQARLHGQPRFPEQDNTPAFPPPGVMTPIPRRHLH